MPDRPPRRPGARAAREGAPELASVDEREGKPTSSASGRRIGRVLREADVRLGDHSAHLVRRVHQRASNIFQELFEGLSLTPPQFAVLGTLLRDGCMSQRELGRTTAIDTATLSSMLGKLERDGFVSRMASSEDQRVNLVGLTERGTELALEGLPRSRQVSEAVLAPLDRQERERFMTLLRKLA